MSWNSSRSWRKPVVEELARLLAMVSRFSCWALMPLAAVYKARIILFLSARPGREWRRYVNSETALDPGQVFGRKLVEVGMKECDRFLQHLRLSLHDDQIQRS